MASPARDSTEAELVDGDAVINAIKDVRSDTTPTDWCGAGGGGVGRTSTLTVRDVVCRMLARHRNLEAQQIELVGSGAGGIDELVANLDDANICYGLCMCGRGGWGGRAR
jgi:hypothetical protein